MGGGGEAYEGGEGEVDEAALEDGVGGRRELLLLELLLAVSDYRVHMLSAQLHPGAFVGPGPIRFGSI